jgi:hypothetical protein
MTSKIRALIIYFLAVSVSPVFAATNSDLEVVRPSCSEPAPLEGNYDPQAPGYIVMLKKTAEATSEMEVLSKRYSFKIDYPFESISSFSAKFSPDVVAKLRCEPTVKIIERNRSTHAL